LTASEFTAVYRLKPLGGWPTVSGPLNETT
jgi:hypothetical protein